MVVVIHSYMSRAPSDSGSSSMPLIGALKPAAGDPGAMVSAD